MEKGTSGKPYITAPDFDKSREDIYNYTLNAFGPFQAERYVDKIQKAIDTLPHWYLLYPECRHMRTKSRMYRNIILDAHLIIYRITKLRVEVLDIVYSASSIGKIRGARGIQL